MGGGQLSQLRRLHTGAAGFAHPLRVKPAKTLTCRCQAGPVGIQTVEGPQVSSTSPGPDVSDGPTAPTAPSAGILAGDGDVDAPACDPMDPQCPLIDPLVMEPPEALPLPPVPKRKRVVDVYVDGQK
jgi:hypothetical protein